MLAIQSKTFIADEIPLNDYIIHHLWIQIHQRAPKVHSETPFDNMDLLYP